MAGENALADVALVFATPTSRFDYDEIFDGKVLADYRTTFGSQSRDSLWSVRFERIVDYAQTLASLAREHGASVYTRAGKADLQHATANCRVVVFVAHWRGAVVGKADVLAAPELLARATELAAHPVLRTLASASNIRTLLSEMNAFVERGDVIQHLPPDIAAVARTSRPVAFTLARDVLDGAFEGLLRPGNRVEMFDGLHTAGDIEAAIAPDFSGELDLTMCNSVVLATLLDIRRGDTIRHVHWPKLVDPLPQYVMIADALRCRVASTRESYIAIRLARHAALQPRNTDVHRTHYQELFHGAWRALRRAASRRPSKGA